MASVKTQKIMLFIAGMIVGAACTLMANILGWL